MPSRSLGATARATVARVRGDGAVVALTIYLVLLLGVPSQLVVAAIGAAGTPAQLYGLLLFLAWVAAWLTGGDREPAGTRALRTAVIVFVIAVFASYTAAAVRPIDGVELRSADRGLISLLSWLGVALVAMDGLKTRQHMDRLLRRVAVGCGLLAALALTQFFSGDPIIDRVSIPGLTANQALVGAMVRGGFTRAAGTASHPIELGVTLALAMPLALHYAMQDSHRRRFARWWPVCAIAISLLVSLSRSAILGAVVGLLIVFPGWTGKQRRAGYALGALLMVGVYIAIPGMLGTLTGLFTGISDDGSARSRTDSYGLAWDFISREPVFGRGFMTFLPSYRILDNAYLGTLIEMGFFGLLATLAMFVMGLYSSWSLLRLFDPSGASLARALTAALAAATVNFATFDAFGFPIVPGLVFLLLGCCGGLSHVAREEHAAAEGAGRPAPQRRPARGDICLKVTRMTTHENDHMVESVRGKS